MKQELADIPVVLNLLDRNLQAETGIMDIEMLHGFLCGVIVSPVPLPPSRWLPRVLTQPAPDQRQAEAEIAAVMRLYNAVTERLSLVVGPDAKPPLRLYVRRLNPDGTVIEGPASRLDPDDPDDTTPADSASGTDAIFKIGELWARGFLDAIDLADQDWVDASQSWELYDEVLHLLTLLLPKSGDSEVAEPVEADDGDSNEVAEGHEDDPTDADTTPAAAPNDTDTLTESIDVAPFDDNDDDDDGFDEELPDPDAPLTTLERAMALGEMSEALHEIYLANRRRTKGSQTFRRESPKVGRNDPCPCGSGRKYKRCHGAN